MNTLTVGFIGLGLIGGSIARVLKKNRPDIYTIAYNRSEAPRKQALADGVIDEATGEIDESFIECDFIFLCTPVEYNSEYLRKLIPFIKKGCIVTDVGSVKGYIHHTVEELGLEECFIGGHPMAGSEKTGYDNASDILLENAFYAITPTKATTQDMLARYIELVRLTGAIPVVLDPEHHDYSVAGISHVPHIIAASLVNLIKHSDDEAGTMKLLAAGGFKDITRIASSSPQMWEQICTTNTDAIVKLLGDYIDYLSQIKDIVASKERSAINAFFDEARQYRNSVADGRKGPIIREHIVYCNIQDKEGALLDIISRITASHISIKNLAIVNNRDSEDGALKILFNNELDKLAAINVLGDCVVQ